MPFKKILKAAFSIKNLVILAGVVIVSYITEYVPFMFVGAAGYLFFVMQTLKDGVIVSDYSENEKIYNLRELNSQCDRLYKDSRKSLDKQSSNNVKDLLQDKEEIMELFIRDENDYTKQKVTENSLNLVMAYIKLIMDYSRRRNEVVSFNTKELVDGINDNEHKIKFLKDYQAIEDIKLAIEMDKQVLDKIEHEKRELEKTEAKLTFIESTLKSLKHQMISRENTDGNITEIENIVNEAAALDNVLNKDRNDRLKV